MKFKQHKKWLALVVAMGMAVSSLVACGDTSSTETGTGTTGSADNSAQTSDDTSTGDSSLAGTKITVWTQRIGDEATALRNACEAFTEETGIIVEFSAPGADYESLLLMNMAANEMPDIWSTHGWAVNRYNEVLADLSGEAWVSRMNPSLLEQVTNADGQVVSMCINTNMRGIGYNVAIFEEYGIEVPTTIDELYEVCEVILEKSEGTITPIHIGGGDAYPIANAMDWLSSTLCTLGDDNDKASLLDGTYDFESYKEMAVFFQTLQNNGYLNVDVLTATNDDTAKAIASGTAAISLQGFNNNATIATYNPETQYGFFAIPAFDPVDEAVVVGGETDSWGVYKDTKNMEACLVFLEYFAREDINAAVCAELKTPSAFNDVTADLGNMTEYYENIKDLSIEPYFDRVYFPSGMWDGMQTYGQLIFTNGYTPDNFASDMSTLYQSLYKGE